MSSDVTRHVLILAALEQEERALLELINREAGTGSVDAETLSARLGLTMSTARLARHSITIIRTGVGSVNAALALTLAQERIPITSVVLLGVGGALSSELDVGDLVISTCVLQHDYFYSFDHGDQRIRPGALILSSEEAYGHTAEIAADPELIGWLKGAEGNSPERGRVFTGPILSGNEFVGRTDRKHAVAALIPGALLVDMEAAGVAQIAGRLGIPFVVAKTVADRLNPDGSIESDFRTCLDAACAHAAAALHSLLYR
jgi:adenosylhomocysteine nucleosidase